MGDRGITHHHFQSGDGRFSFTSTTYRPTTSNSPRRRPPAHEGPPLTDPLLPLLRNFDTIFHGIANTYNQQGPGPRRTGNPGIASNTPPVGPAESNPTGNGGRNTFTATGRLWPRDANNPQPDAQPFENMNEYAHPSPHTCNRRLLTSL